MGYGSSRRTKIRTIEDVDDSKSFKISTGIREVDHVLGGGVEKGGVYLLAADAGTGKSTITLQILSNLSSEYNVLLITGEEALSQVKDRAKRLDVSSDKIFSQYNTCLKDVLDSMRSHRPDILVIDSVQAMSDPDKTSAPGSPSQIKSVTQAVTTMAKSLGICTILIGQYTKANGIAGPKVMEHIVDCVLRMDRDMITGETLLSCKKNRMGSTDKIGLLKMTEKGLVETSYEELLKDKKDRLLIPLLKDGRFSIAEVECSVDFGKNNLSCENVQASHIKRILRAAKNSTNFNFDKLDISIRASEPIDKDDTFADLGLFSAILLAYLLESPSGYVITGKLGINGQTEATDIVNKIVSYCQQAGIKRIISPLADSGEKIESLMELLPVLTGEKL
jgi:DNA repair protein RadA/Sms